MILNWSFLFEFVFTLSCFVVSSQGVCVIVLCFSLILCWIYMKTIVYVSDLVLLLMLHLCTFLLYFNLTGNCTSLCGARYHYKQPTVSHFFFSFSFSFPEIIVMHSISWQSGTAALVLNRCIWLLIAISTWCWFLRSQ